MQIQMPNIAWFVPPCDVIHHRIWAPAPEMMQEIIQMMIFSEWYDRSQENAGWFISQAQGNDKEMGYMSMREKQVLSKLPQVIHT